MWTKLCKRERMWSQKKGEKETESTHTHKIQKKNWPVDKPNSPLLLAEPANHNSPISNTGVKGEDFLVLTFKAQSLWFLERVQIQPTSPMTSLELVPCDAGLWDLRRLFFFFFFVSDGMCLFILASVGGNCDTWKIIREEGLSKCESWHAHSGTGLMKLRHWRINSLDTNGGKTRLTRNFFLVRTSDSYFETAVILSCVFLTCQHHFSFRAMLQSYSEGITLRLFHYVVNYSNRSA